MTVLLICVFAAIPVALIVAVIIWRGAPAPREYGNFPARFTERR